MRGRMFGLLSTLTAAVISLGFALAGFITDLVDQNIPLVYLMFSGIAAVSILGFVFNRDLIAFLSIIPADEEEGAAEHDSLRDDQADIDKVQLNGKGAGHNDR